MTAEVSCVGCGRAGARQTRPPTFVPAPQRRPSPTYTSDDTAPPGPPLAPPLLARDASPHTRPPPALHSLPATRLRAALSPRPRPRPLPRSLSCGPGPRPPGTARRRPRTPTRSPAPLSPSVQRYYKRRLTRDAMPCFVSEPRVHGLPAPRPGPFADYATEQALSSCPSGLPACPPPALADSLHAQARLPGPQQAFQSPNPPMGLAPRFAPGASQFPPSGGGNVAAQSPYCSSPRPTAGAQGYPGDPEDMLIYLDRKRARRAVCPPLARGLSCVCVRGRSGRARGARAGARSKRRRRVRAGRRLQRRLLKAARDGRLQRCALLSAGARPTAPRRPLDSPAQVQRRLYPPPLPPLPPPPPPLLLLLLLCPCYLYIEATLIITKEIFISV
ncbi:Protein of unknown function [Gryllus bimaculatus]|nr:Protein of unknown function [Gryllus bimaculatus]